MFPPLIYEMSIIYAQHTQQCISAHIHSCVWLIAIYRDLLQQLYTYRLLFFCKMHRNFSLVKVRDKLDGNRYEFKS